MANYRHRAYGQLLLVVIIWGISAPVIKFTLSGIDPFAFLAYRFAISAVIAAFYLAIKGVKVPKKKHNLLLVIIYGILAFSIALSLLFVGIDESTVLDVTLLGLAGPLVVTAGGVLFFRDRITHREKIGITIALFGALINSLSPLLREGDDIHLTGNLFIIGFLIADSGAVLLSKKLDRNNVPAETTTMIGFIVAALTLIPFAFIIKSPSFIVQEIMTLPLKYHLGVWFMAIFSGLIAYFLAIKATKSIEVSEAWLFMYLQPIFTIPLAILWLGETITVSFAFGAAIIALGVFLAERKPRKVPASN